MQDEIRIGLIGAGGRLAGVYEEVARVAPGQVRLARYFDPDPKTGERLKHLPHAEHARAMASWQSVVEDDEVDAVMVGSPNAFHADPAILAMEVGKPLFLEKPLAATLVDHQRLLQAQRRTDARVAVGFVLRYTPFYRTIKEIVDSGRLGRIQYLHAVEHMGILLTADVYLRGWRAYRKEAGPLLLEKCCHDIDIINWLMGVPCETVSALDDQTVFANDETRPLRCPECGDKGCAYRGEGSISARASAESGVPLYLSGSDDACIYHRGQDISDHTTVLARYQGGVHVTFNVTMGVARGGRWIDIVGSKGKLSGFAEGNTITFTPLGRGAKTETIIPAISHPGRHYGGEFMLAEDFLRICRDPFARSVAGIAEGYESGAICLAADEAARIGQPVEIARYRI